MSLRSQEWYRVFEAAYLRPVEMLPDEHMVELPQLCGLSGKSVYRQAMQVKGCHDVATPMDMRMMMLKRTLGVKAASALCK